MSAAPSREFVIAVIVPEKEYLLRRLAEAEGAPLQSYLDLDQAHYQKLLDSNTTVEEIFSSEFRIKEVEYSLAEYECVSEGRFYLTAKAFSVTDASDPMEIQSAPILTHSMKIKRHEADKFFSSQINEVLLKLTEDDTTSEGSSINMPF